jgi:serine/threonine-protein kinase
MALTDPLILPPDVLLLPARRLSAGQRKQYGARLGDFALTRPQGRSHSKIVTPVTAELLARFRTATLVVDAVRAHGEQQGQDAERVLEEAYPVLAECYDAGLLVPAHSPAAREIRPLFERGERIGRFTVVRAVRVLDDSEVYLGRTESGTAVALKILRPGWRRELADAVAREGRLLASLRGRATPRLLARGRHRRRPFLALEWCAGVPPELAFAELRDERSTASRQRLLLLADRVLGAYVRLHAQGVLHGDVQPDNLLIDAEGRVRLLDFGWARRIRGRPPFPHRAGLGYYFEPELARAIVARRSVPPTTLAGEQFAIAAMLYYLLTGGHYLEFQLQRETMLRQIDAELPLPFSRRQAAPWPAVEAVLARALAKEPADRFRSVALFRSALKRAAGIAPVSGAAADSRSRADIDPVADTLAAVDSNGPLFREGPGTSPTCSVWLGAAGIAFGLYRMALCRDDARLLACADLWLSKAEREAGRAEAFVGPEITPAEVGRVSLYHSPTGLYAVRALLAGAVGDLALTGAAVARFIGAAELTDPPGLDLAFGRAGLLLGATLLFEALPEDCEDSEDALRAFGQRQVNGIREALALAGPIATCQAIPELGIAHGWGGILYSLIRWCTATGASPPARLTARLVELAALGEEVGRGLRWRSVNPGAETSAALEYVPGWCNGSAGYVHLWTAAAGLYPRSGFDELGVRAAWNAWETTDGLADLCCGATGRAYALLSLYRHTGDAVWLERARTLHRRLLTGLATARTAPRYAQSLYKGTMGLALLTVDLDRPESAAMPLFESEGWPPRARHRRG